MKAKTVVLDNGASTIKLGVTGVDKQPRCVCVMLTYEHRSYPSFFTGIYPMACFDPRRTRQPILVKN